MEMTTALMMKDWMLLVLISAQLVSIVEVQEPALNFNGAKELQTAQLSLNKSSDQSLLLHNL
jgi:hypothetical protein